MTHTTASSREDVLVDMQNVIRETGEVPPNKK